jgi:potassium efflux system protein
VTDSLHTQINNAFNDAGIEISFPQRDLHLRTVDGVASDAIANLKK